MMLKAQTKRNQPPVCPSLVGHRSLTAGERPQELSRPSFFDYGLMGNATFRLVSVVLDG